MKRKVSFSTPYDNDNFHKILNLIFPSDMKDKLPLFMLLQGVQNTLQKYLDDWEHFAQEYDLKIDNIDNIGRLSYLRLLLYEWIFN
jgi:hypothetical protein